ncbi:MAG: hypothetical protein CMJ45_01400 [Planctomyces sp.]|nr:hypothetical protein [Planctomyces sp.]
MQNAPPTNNPSERTRSAVSSRGWAFYFDGDCRFCTNVVRTLAKIDLLNRVDWVPYQSLESPPTGLSWKDLDRAAYLETGSSRLHEGFYAFRMLTLRVLPLLPLAPLLWLPGMAVLGAPAYRWVARNRHRITSCLYPDRKS